jgi:hypothetical protein
MKNKTKEKEIRSGQAGRNLKVLVIVQLFFVVALLHTCPRLKNDSLNSQMDKMTLERSCNKTIVVFISPWTL